MAEMPAVVFNSADVQRALGVSLTVAPTISITEILDALRALQQQGRIHLPSGFTDVVDYARHQLHLPPNTPLAPPATLVPPTLPMWGGKPHLIFADYFAAVKRDVLCIDGISGVALTGPIGHPATLICVCVEDVNNIALVRAIMALLLPKIRARVVFLHLPLEACCPLASLSVGEARATICCSASLFGFTSRNRLLFPAHERLAPGTPVCACDADHNATNIELGSVTESYYEAGPHTDLTIVGNLSMLSVQDMRHSLQPESTWVETALIEDMDDFLNMVHASDTTMKIHTRQGTHIISSVCGPFEQTAIMEETNIHVRGAFLVGTFKRKCLGKHSGCCSNPTCTKSCDRLIEIHDGIVLIGKAGSEDGDSGTPLLVKH